MKFTSSRWLASAAVAVAAVVTPLSLSGVLPGIGGGSALLAGAGTPASPDTIVFGEGTVAGSNYMDFVSGSTGTTTTEAVTPSQGCNPPGIGGVPLLTLAAFVYPNGTYAAGTKPSAANAVVADAQNRTGVCSGRQQDLDIDNDVRSAQALDFGIGGNSLVTGREFSEAQLNIFNYGTSTGEGDGSRSGFGDGDGDSDDSPTTITLLETLNGAPAGSQTCAIAPGATISADTSLPAGGPCSGTAPTPFDDLELQVTTLNGKVSVTGPTSTFTLASQICGGQSIQSTGPVAASLSLTGASSVCKSYTSFSSGPNATGQEALSFNGFSAGSVPFTVNVNWPAVPLCQPYADSNIPAAVALPVCAPHQFSFNNVTYYDQSYCQTATPPGTGVLPQQEFCTANKNYNNDNYDSATGTVTPIMTTGASPVAGTQISEVWVGDFDWWVK